MHIEEKWADLESWPNYQVSSLGRVKRKTGTNYEFKRGAIMNTHPQNGKLTILLRNEAGQKRRLVESLVAETFLDAYDKDIHRIVYLDNDRTNLAASNLALKTKKEVAAEKLAARISLKLNKKHNKKSSYSQEGQNQPETGLGNIAETKPTPKKQYRMPLSYPRKKITPEDYNDFLNNAYELFCEIPNTKLAASNYGRIIVNDETKRFSVTLCFRRIYLGLLREILPYLTRIQLDRR